MAPGSGVGRVSGIAALGGGRGPCPSPVRGPGAGAALEVPGGAVGRPAGPSLRWRGDRGPARLGEQRPGEQIRAVRGGLCQARRCGPGGAGWAVPDPACSAAEPKCLLFSLKSIKSPFCGH